MTSTPILPQPSLVTALLALLNVISASRLGLYERRCIVLTHLVISLPSIGLGLVSHSMPAELLEDHRVLEVRCWCDLVQYDMYSLR